MEKRPGSPGAERHTLPTLAHGGSTPPVGLPYGGLTTMQRRKLLLGLGTTAGGAGAVGSGAFTSVNAQRDVAVRVADDSDALLSLQPGSSENAAAFSTITDCDRLSV